MIVLLIFLAWKVIDTWTVFIAGKTIPYLGFFPYKKELFEFGQSQLTQSLANFDGIHYLLIAHRGNYMSWEQAYFPLFPIIIRLFNFIPKNELITGLIVSNLCLLTALLIVSKLFNKKNIFWFMILLLSFPTSFFFGAIYTEGLFFLLLILVLYFLKKGNYILVFLLSVFASLTRLIGVFILLPIAFHFFGKYKKLTSKSWILIAPIIGLAIYCFYLLRTTGDLFFFLTSQPVFGANRSAHLILLPQVIWRYIKILLTSSHTYQYFVSLSEFIIFTLVSIVLVLDILKHFKFKLNGWRIKVDNFDRFGLSLFSFANLLLPTLTGTLSSVPRYTLFSISLFLYLSEIKNRIIKVIIFTIFFVFHILALALFSQGYFVG